MLYYSTHFPRKLTVGLGAHITLPLLNPQLPSHLHHHHHHTTTGNGGSSNRHTAMLLSVVLALFLPCAGMTLVFIVYLCLLCYAARHHHQTDAPVKPAAAHGLSSAELQKLPVTTGKDLVLGTECAVCLDDVEPEQPARVFPGCNHGFHLKCADTWLSKNPVCPVCRNKLDSGFFAPTETTPC